MALQTNRHRACQPGTCLDTTRLDSTRLDSALPLWLCVCECVCCLPAAAGIDGLLLLPSSLHAPQAARQHNARERRRRDLRPWQRANCQNNFVTLIRTRLPQLVVVLCMRFSPGTTPSPPASSFPSLPCPLPRSSFIWLGSHHLFFADLVAVSNDRMK